MDNSCILCNSTVSCLKCSGGLVALGSTCTFPCPTGTYDHDGLCLCKLFSEDEVLLLFKKIACKTLDNNCLTCNSSIACTSCDNSKYALGKTCVDNCPQFVTYIKNGICTCKKWIFFVPYI